MPRSRLQSADSRWCDAYILPWAIFPLCPHSWDDLPPERVVLDFLILSSYREIEAKEMDKLKREQSFDSNKGRTVRTTSDSDFFEKMNARLTENG